MHVEPQEHIVLEGKVGINVPSSTPHQYFPLTVYDAGTSLNNYYYFRLWDNHAPPNQSSSNSLGISTWQTYGRNISIYSNYGVWGEAFFVSSDRRIKTNIRDVSDNVALQKLRDISCVNYEYKDKLARGTDTTIGFIAQQVKEHMPMAVSIQKDIIPNEMRNIETLQWTTIPPSPDASGNVDPSANNTYKLTISDLSDNSGNTLYRFYVSNDPSGNDECQKDICSLIDDPKSFIFDQSWNNVFIYGKRIDDFHIIDKPKLFALNFSATQEIDRIQQAEKTKLEQAELKIATLEAENATLKTQIADILSRLQTLENA